MKTTLRLILFFLLGFFQMAYAQVAVKAKTDVAMAGLKGKVKQVTRNRFEAIIKGTEISPGKPILLTEGENNIYIFDEKERELERQIYFGKTTIFRPVSTSSYNKDASLKETSVYSIRMGKWYKTSYKLDKNGYVIEQDNHLEDGGIYSKSKIKYDAKGNMIELCEYGADEALTSKNTYKYDDQGSQVETVHYKPNGSIDYSSKSKYVYDIKGNLVEKANYTMDDKLTTKLTYVYDERGNKIEQALYNSEGGLMSRSTHQYDKVNNEIEAYTYDGNGKQTSKYVATFEYDEKDNWIKLITYFNNDPPTYDRRIIEYYP
jgi:hypothetical protein